MKPGNPSPIESRPGSTGPIAGPVLPSSIKPGDSGPISGPRLGPPIIF